jgi:asparagine N-glycosylation enzyme membrane subunit Stt3
MRATPRIGIGRALPLLGALIAVGVLAYIPRYYIQSDRHPYERGEAEWFSREPDGLYHARRVERAMSEGTVAQQDPWMNYPQGAKIPWPPYYDLFLAKVFAPFAPADEEARWHWIERATASVPFVCGIAAVLIAALAAWRIAGLTGAAVTGVTVALCRGTLNYSSIGNGDHHAWIALLNAITLLTLSEALRRGAIVSRMKGALFGTGLGLLCGLMIGSWVAAIFYVVNLQIVLGWMLFRRAREPLPGVATLGLVMHLAAIVTLFPAVWESPWRLELPWMVVNLSWFHLTELALGAFVFVPLVTLGSGRLAAESRWARRYPFTVAVALGTLALVSWLFRLAPARGIAEGVAWVSRADSFMSRVAESMPLVGQGAEEGVLFFALGYGILVLPIALGFAAWRALRHRNDELLPWVVAVAALLPQALMQRRFADILAVPMAVVLGWGAVHLVRYWRPRVFAPVVVILAFMAQFPSVQTTWQWLEGSNIEWIGTGIDPVVGERRAFEWIREHKGDAGEASVLSHWDRGHTIEWAAASPSVANNFGSYIGIDSYRAPALFFLDESPARAEKLLEGRRVRYVYVPVQIITLTQSLCKAIGPMAWNRYVRSPTHGNLPVSSVWFSTMAGRLLVGGVPVDIEGNVVAGDAEPIGYLRLVHVTPQYARGTVGPVTGQPFPVGQVWERVPGAIVEAGGNTGEELLVELEIAYEGSDYRLPWRSRAEVGADRVARIRVPYSTTVPNGDGRIINARWDFPGGGGELEIPEAAVLAGDIVRLR